MKLLETQPFRAIRKFGQEWKSFSRENTPVPEQLQCLWPNEKPYDTIDHELSDKELWSSYLYLDRVKEEQHLMGLSGEFSKHFHQYWVVDKGLDLGVVEWKQAREVLYDAISSQKPEKLTDIYLFWIDSLSDFIAKDRLEGGSVAGMEAWSDRVTLERKALESISMQDRPLLRAYYTAAFVDAKIKYLKKESGDESAFVLSDKHKEELGNLMSKEATNIMRILPLPIDFARVYRRSGDKSVYGEVEKPKGYESHGNDFYWLNVFASVGRKHGFGGRDGKTGGIVGGIEKYLLNVLKVYDPALGYPYMTGTLLQFSRKDFVDKKLRNFFRRRVATSVDAFGPGFGNRNTLIEAMASNEAQIGNLKTAYKLMAKIQEETSVMHVASNLMEIESLHGDPAIIEAKYAEVLSPLVAKKWHRDAGEIERGRSKFAKHERHTWMLQWVLSGIRTAENDNNYSIFRRNDVIRYIRRGEIDTLLSTIARACSDNPESKRLNRAVVSRISAIFNAEKEAVKVKKDGFVDSSDLHEALEALFILRKKDLVNWVLEEQQVKPKPDELSVEESINEFMATVGLLKISSIAHIV